MFILGYNTQDNKDFKNVQVFFFPLSNVKVGCSRWIWLLYYYGIKKQDSFHLVTRSSLINTCIAKMLLPAPINMVGGGWERR